MLNTKNYNLAEYWEEDDFNLNQPTKVRMRDYYGKGDHVIRDKHYDHDPHFWKDLERFLDARVGRDFDYVFSEFCNKFPKYIGRENTRVKFMTEFRRYYTIDDHNRLRRDPKAKWWQIK